MIVGIAVLLRVFIRSEFYQCLFFFYWDDHMTFPLFSVNVINCTICNDVLFFLYVMTFALLIFCLVFFFFSPHPRTCLQKGREKERERENRCEKNISQLPSTGDWTCNPGGCPDWEPNWQLFSAWDDALEPLQPGRESLHTCLWVMCFW